MRRVAAVLSCAVTTQACSTHYVPQPGPRLSVIIDGGQIAYARDGKKFNHGFFGGGLVKAVEDDPEAREAAETYRGRNVGGFVSTLVGELCLIGGLVTLAANLDSQKRSTNDLALGAIACGVAGVITGAVFFATAQPYQWDAINIYNDNVERRRPVWVALPPPPVLGPTTSPSALPPAAQPPTVPPTPPPTSAPGAPPNVPPPP
jgi:hypothetical protein